MIKRFMDIIGALAGLILLSPLLLGIALAIVSDSRGGVFYRQQRVGKNGSIFKLYKFRSMRPLSEQKGLLTVGDKDNRITRVGYFIRKYKLDELPQLINILKGDMSIVGPRPEVEKYVNLYTPDQRKVLTVRPGLTDYASLEYFKESELLAKSENPENTYIQDIMPEKLRLNLKYIEEHNLLIDLKIIGKTIKKIVSR